VGGVEDRVIATIGENRVMYGKVWCSRELAAANPKWLRGQTVEEACVEAERERFRIVAGHILAKEICAIEGCEPADADIEPFRSPILKNETMLRDLATLAWKVPEAVRRVYRGEALEAVYDEAIRPMNHSLEVFRREVAMYRSLEVVERYLAKDFVANAREQFEERARDMARREALRKRVEALAASRNQPLPWAAEEYLRSMIERIGVTVADPQFALPSGPEVLLRPSGLPRR